MPPTSKKIEGLLFDLGGVLIQIDFNRAFKVWEGLCDVSAEEIRGRFKMDAVYECHERGEIDATEYFAHLRKLLGVKGTDQEIAAGWNAIFGEEITQTVDYISIANKLLPSFAFTNTNAIHQAEWMLKYPSVVSVFEHIFVSSELGLRKPERAAFAAISRATQIEAENLLFFDDTLENVDGARRAGLQAVHVQSPADIEQALLAVGALTRER